MIITNESSGVSTTHDPGGSSGDVFSVGEEVGFNTSAQSTTWGLQTGSEPIELS